MAGRAIPSPPDLMKGNDVMKNNDKLVQARNRDILRIRIIEGFKQLIKRPWKCVSIIMLTVAFFWAREKLTPALLPLEKFIPAQFGKALGSMFLILCILLFALLLLLTISIIGTPLRVGKYDRIFNAALSARDREYGAGCPVLISASRIKGTKVTRLEFYSVGVPMETWMERENRIMSAMNAHLVEPIQYGGKHNNDRRRIVLFTAPGAKPQSKGTLTDEF
jgi:hypothetical protein